MMCGENAGEHSTERQSDEDRRSCVGLVHDRERIADVVVEAIGGGIGRPIGPAVPAAVIGNAAEAPAEIRQLRLVNPRMDDAPGRQEEHGLRAAAMDLVEEPYALALYIAGVVGFACAHDEISLLPGFQAPQHCAEAP